MSRHILSLSDEQLTAYDLDAFVAHAEVLNQHNRDTFTTPFPNLICDHGVYLTPTRPLAAAHVVVV